MKLVDDVVKFCKDLIVGDFESQPSNAAMIVGGLISLIPIVDQVMDVRDVSGMIYRINKKGTRNCTKDDWVDLAMAAFGCIPEVGSLFKTIVKPLWKGRKGLSGALRGAAFIEAMLGKAKGRAIKYIKAFDWARNTQIAISTTLAAIDTCDAFLGELSKPHWWVPDELEGLARDLRPALKQTKGAIRSGIQEGSQALREFVTELIGEDGYRVVQLATTAAVVASSNPGARRSSARAPAAPVALRPTSRQQAPHPPMGGGSVRDRTPGQGPAARATRLTRAVLKDIGARYKGLIGEHMAHYHHMNRVAVEAWPHGRIGSQSLYAGEKKLVTERNGPATPTELVPEHLARINQQGIDGVWSLGNGTFHFVEAKMSESAGAMFGLGYSRAVPSTKTDASARAAAKLAPPTGLTERQLALWYMLGQPKKGLQMGKDWLIASAAPSMARAQNFGNRCVYVFFAVPSVSPPKNYAPAPGGPLKKGIADGILKHIEVSAEVAQRMIAGGDVYELALHDQHKPNHGLSDEFASSEIDVLDRVFQAEKHRVALRPRPIPSGGSSGGRRGSL